MIDIDIEGCETVPMQPNSDARGCLFEIFREEWPGAFPTVQWNACVSRADVMRGVHVHADYAEYYTLPSGLVHIGLKDIRRDSATYMHGVDFEWSADDGFAVTVPAGVAHAVYFIDDSVLAFGLSGYWSAELDVLGCHWSEPELGFDWPTATAALSARDTSSGSFADMVTGYEALRARLESDRPVLGDPLVAG